MSCGKDQQVYNEEIDSSKMSLSDFLASTTDEDISLMGKNIVDNSRSTSFKSKQPSLKASVSEEEEVGIGIKFKWHGTDPRTHGCIKPLGICITFGYEEIQNISPEEVNADVYILDGNKLVIHPRTEENGLTSDGYLPVGNYVPYGDITTNKTRVIQRHTK